jgi:hypothetical protein
MHNGGARSISLCSSAAITSGSGSVSGPLGRYVSALMRSPGPKMIGGTRSRGQG